MKLRLLCLSAALSFSPTAAAQCDNEGLSSPNPSFLSGFGQTIDRDGKFLVVGEDGGSGALGRANVYQLSNGQWIHEADITAYNGQAGDGYGRYVAIDGDRLLVGAPFREYVPGKQGVVYLYERDNSGPDPVWEIRGTFLAPDDQVAPTLFGYAADIEGDVVVIGAMDDNAAGETEAGAAYVYRYNGAAWPLVQTLTSSDPNYNEGFGSEIELDGDALLVSAPGDDTLGYYVGAVHAYRDTGTSFVHEEKLMPPPPFETQQAFGASIDMDTAGGTQRIVVGGSSTVQQQGVGRVYVYRRETSPGQATTYAIEDGILATDGSAGDSFGLSVSIQGDRLLVGAWKDDDMASEAGAAYLYERDGSEWKELRKLHAPDPASGDRFGHPVVMDGDRGLFGMINEDATYNAEGMVVVLPLDTIDCPAVCDAPQLPTASDGSGSYGASVGIDGDSAAVGSPSDDTHGTDAGRVRVYHRFDDCWTEAQELVLAETEADDLFGHAIAIDDDRVVVGAPGDEANFTFSGMAYVFRRLGVAWAFDGQLAPWGVGPNAQFGRSVAIDEEKAMVGYLSPGTAGAVRAFREVVTGAWAQDDTLFSLDAVVGDDFGASIAIDGDRSAIGAPGTDGSGAVYAFDYANFEWTEDSRVTSPITTSGADFGADVALEGGRLVVAAPGIESVFVFEEVHQPFFGPTFTLRATLTAPVAGVGFASSVALDGSRIVVGTPAGSGLGAGASYVYETNGYFWTLVRTVRPAGSADGDLFGASVDLSGDTLMAGAPGLGAAFAYELDEPVPAFAADAHTISIADGGTQSFALDAGPAHAGKLYWILGSVTGTAPGTMLLNALMPLNQDAYFDLLLLHPDASTVSPIIDFLDADGRASSGVTVVPGTLTGHEGLVIDHAYLLLGGGQIDFVSNAVSMVLVP